MMVSRQSDTSRRTRPSQPRRALSSSLAASGPDCLDTSLAARRRFPMSAFAKVELSCQRCGVTFLVHRYRATSARFCSKVCQDGPTVSVACTTCGSPFERIPSKVRERNYCSKTCADHVKMDAHRIPVVDRFWAKVDKNGPLSEHRPDLGPCWLWTASTNANGYGQLSVDRRPQLAHIIAFRLDGGQIHSGHELDHLCRVRGCVRPSHLEPVTHAENVRRGSAGLLTTHCPRGHPYVGENVRLYRGHRYCRRCYGPKGEML